MEPASTTSIKWAVLALGLIFALALPITTREAYAFTHFVRPPVRDLLGTFDPADPILNTLLTKRAVGLFRLSTFSLRASGLLGLALYLWSMARLLRDRWLPLALAGALFLALDFCTPGTGVGLALALWVTALRLTIAYLQENLEDGLRNLNLCGVCLGLSVAANFCFLIPSLALVGALCWKLRQPTLWVDRVLLTGTVTAFLLLVLPFSHATAGELSRHLLPPPLEISRTPEDLTALVAILRRESQGRTVRIAATADLLPVLQFYQARYRAGGWRLVGFPGSADYYVVDIRRQEIPGRTLYRGRWAVLAQ
jgi:hypothetical protein